LKMNWFAISVFYENVLCLNMCGVE
jgi:hypothetical protein